MKRGLLSIQESGVFGGTSWCEDISSSRRSSRGTTMSRTQVARPGNARAQADFSAVTGRCPGADTKVTGDGDDLFLQGSRFLSVKSRSAQSVDELTGEAQTNVLEKMARLCSKWVSPQICTRGSPR